MGDAGWFDGIALLGDLPANEYEDYLRRVGDPSAQDPDAGPDTERALTLRRRVQPFNYTGSQVGHIRPGPDRYLRIVDPRDIEPDRALAHQRFTVQLTQALVARYPGHGSHEILLHFDAGDGGMKDERMQFGSTVRSADGSTPALVGQVLFSGLRVAADGLSIRLRTINVSSEDDARLLAVLQSDVFRGGLDLAASVGPAIGLLSQTLGSIATYFASRASNKPVQDGLLAVGLQRDLVDAPKLRLGSYVLAQAPSDLGGRLWSWADYVYDRERGVIVESRNTETAIGYNYIALGIGRTEG